MIVVNEISKWFGDFRAIDRVSLDVPAQESVAILGPSGSGKTTLLRLIAGLDPPDKGEIRIDGKLASKPGWVLSPHLRSMSLVFQTPALWPHLTVAQNILFGLNNTTKAKAYDRLNEILTRTSLSGLAKRYPHQISGGEARRVALARALAPQRRVLLMDEPLTNLNPELKKDLLYLIQEVTTSEQTTLVYVTHDVDEARQVSQRLLVLENGRLERQPEATHR